MTKISIAAASPTSDVEATTFLHQRFKMSLIGSQKKLAMGDKGFFYAGGLYGNDHVQREKEIRDIISFFQLKKIDLLILEIDDDQDWGGAGYGEPRSVRYSSSGIVERPGFFCGTLSVAPSLWKVIPAARAGIETISQTGMAPYIYPIIQSSLQPLNRHMDTKSA